MSRRWMMYRSQFERGALLTLNSNSAPTNITLSATSIAEDAGLGSLMATISGTDPNTGDTLTYSLTDDAGGRFSISGSNLIVSGVLDYETRPTESITIRATDSGGLTFDKTFTITVTDVAETTPSNPLPGGTTTDDGSFANPVAATTVSGSVKLSGKKSSGSSGKFVYSIASAPTAGTKYTCQYDPDFSLLSQGGKLAAVGFGLKNGNNFHLMTLMGNGSTGLNVAKASGSNFTATTGQTITTVGAAHNGTQAGPNWIQLEISSDGLTYTLRTSPDGTTWTDEITGATPSPLTSATSATSFGLAAYFDGTDTGSFVIDVKLWQSALATLTTTLDPANVNSSISLSNGNLTATGINTAIGKVRSTVGQSTGLRYFEFTPANNTNWRIGLANGSWVISETLTSLGSDAAGNSVGFATNGGYVSANTTTAGTLDISTVNQAVGVLVDLTPGARTIRVFKPAGNGASQTYALPTAMQTGTLYAAFATNAAVGGTFNFGASAFSGTVPPGATSWDLSKTGTYANTLWPMDRASSYTLSNGNLTAAKTGESGTWRSVKSDKAHTTGKWVFEVSHDAITTYSLMGIGTDASTVDKYLGQTTTGVGWLNTGNVYNNAVATYAAGPTFAAGNKTMMAVDLDAHTVQLIRAGASTVTVAIPAAMQGLPIYAGVSASPTGTQQTVNFGATAFANAVPSGYSAWNG